MKGSFKGRGVVTRDRTVHGRAIHANEGALFRCLSSPLKVSASAAAWHRGALPGYGQVCREPRHKSPHRTPWERSRQFSTPGLAPVCNLALCADGLVNENFYPSLTYTVPARHELHNTPVGESNTHRGKKSNSSP